ncbi:MAG: non-canonical purine NTP pyrophosphatase, RdgB/HAM1 family [Candidatus Marinimicrobia bacterium]|jgi:XTP/dITP diphosphohydrolase|nr:non-canonical purine NTP pyrophosphatase, RdgB/HAM1 family [Candidatus Neomarinimicrobiota bacterium]|tara:strand:+ start:1529 stop:2149 length:621 start_codon:yes stop_codon:yes gene_type:complete
MSRRRKLVLATHNSHKKTEMNTLLAPLGISIVGLDDFPQIGDIEETGTTLLENSLIKARSVHQITGLPSLADDTGLEVDALDGAPGVYSARFAGENPTYEDNVNKLLSKLEGVSAEKRTARFRTIIAFVDGRRELFAEGIIEGLITVEPCGHEGFGYDPIFLPETESKTFAEMSQERKNQISHRGRALAKMQKKLNNYFNKGESIE